VSVALGQTAPNLENGFKPYGSYHGSGFETVSEMNGNLTIHLPWSFVYPQRGGRLETKTYAVFNAKNWKVQVMSGSPGAVVWTQNDGWGPGQGREGDPLHPNRTNLRGRQ